MDWLWTAEWFIKKAQKHTQRENKFTCLPHALTGFPEGPARLMSQKKKEKQYF